MYSDRQPIGQVVFSTVCILTTSIIITKQAHPSAHEWRVDYNLNLHTIPGILYGNRDTFIVVLLKDEVC